MALTFSPNQFQIVSAHKLLLLWPVKMDVSSVFSQCWLQTFILPQVCVTSSILCVRLCAGCRYLRGMDA